MSAIIERLYNIIKITHSELDYILIEDIMKEYQDIIVLTGYNERTIKRIIYEYLKKNVNIKDYSSKVFGKYNKRGYLGIVWKDSSKMEKNTSHYHFYKNHNLKELLDNESASKDFINKIDNMIQNNVINWPPMNIVYYIRVLLKDCMRLILEEQKKVIKEEFQVSLKVNKEIKRDKVNNEIKKVNMKENERIDFYKYLDENIIETGNEKDIIFTKDILMKYEEVIKNKIDNKYKYYLSTYVLETYCAKNIEILEKKYKYRTKFKRGYRYLTLK